MQTGLRQEKKWTGGKKVKVGQKKNRQQKVAVQKGGSFM